MLSVSQSKKPLDQISLPIKNCSISSLSTTSDYSSVHFDSDSLSSFFPSEKQLRDSPDFSDFTICNDFLVDSLKLHIENQPLLTTVKKIFYLSNQFLNICFKNPKHSQYDESVNAGGGSKQYIKSSHKNASIEIS